MINLIASILVLLTGLYLIGLAVVTFWAPARAMRFLAGLASSAVTHYLELGLRLVAGAAILLSAPQMLFSGFFVVAGWVLVATTAGLAVIPWQWHHRFAQRAVPYATRNLWLVAVASFLLGGFVLASVVLGSGFKQWGDAAV